MTGRMVRLPSRGNFTQVPNELVNDDRLSFKAKGIMLMLLSLPPWHDGMTSDTLAGAGPDGRTAVLSALKELREAGYMRLVRTQDSQGKWSSKTYFTEVAGDFSALDGQQPVENLELTEVGLTEVGKPDLGQPEVGFSDVGKPDRKSTKTVPKTQDPGEGGENHSPRAVDNFSPPNPLTRADRCAAHQLDAYPPPCGRCKDARLLVEDLDRQAAHDPTLIRKCEHNHVASSCPYCPGGRLHDLEEVS